MTFNASDGITASLPTGSAFESPKRTTAAIIIAKCSVEYTVDWDGLEGAAGPCLAAVELLHVARQFADTSRWWAMRWPQNAVSLVGGAGALSPGKTYQLKRALRKHPLNYLDQLWMLASDRRHAKDATAQMAEIKADWCRVQKLLGTWGRAVTRPINICFRGVDISFPLRRVILLVYLHVAIAVTRCTQLCRRHHTDRGSDGYQRRRPFASTSTRTSTRGEEPAPEAEI